jgi:3,4-dihydroxy 2-butanone 4-phosphate synthase / GTP cyclohydrolase II
MMLAVADIVRQRRGLSALVHYEAAGRVPTAHGEFTALTYRSADGVEHVALVLGELDAARQLARPTDGPDGLDDAVLVRVHSECLTGDVFGSRRCDCGEQLDCALARIAAEGRGVVVYLRGQEGRGIGLSHKLRAYTLQDGGLDTVDANLVQGLPIDSREYGVGAQILRDLGADRVRLMTNNPAKERGLAEHGVRIVRREPLVTPPNPDNISYLTTKRVRMNHDLEGLTSSDAPRGEHRSRECS